jgi:hypothetical protein
VGRAGSLRYRAVDGAEQVVGVDLFKIDKKQEFVIVAHIPDRIPQFCHRTLIVRGFKLNFPVGGLFHRGGDGMECGHIHAGTKKHGLFADPTFAEPDVLRRGRKDVHKKALMFLIRAGEQAANGINGLVLLFEEGAQIGFRAAFGRVIHLGSDLGKHRNRITM